MSELLGEMVDGWVVNPIDGDYARTTDCLFVGSGDQVIAFGKKNGKTMGDAYRLVLRRADSPSEKSDGHPAFLAWLRARAIKHGMPLSAIFGEAR